MVELEVTDAATSGSPPAAPLNLHAVAPVCSRLAPLRVTTVFPAAGPPGGETLETA
jgi:hypothetical protein